jgi:WD40 repeat protein
MTSTGGGRFEAREQATQYNARTLTVNNAYHPTGGTVRCPWLAPPLPAGMVARPALTDGLLQQVCGDTGTPAGLTGVHGTGGFGKTTLAVWLCHQEQARRRFPGGLLWVTVGEHAAGPDLASKVNDLVGQLTGVRSTYTDPEQAGLYLGQLLDAQPDPVLLVVDDVWSEPQLEPFRCGGERCRRLVTTRNPWILPAGSVRFPVDLMSIDEAARLLTRDLPEADPGAVAAVLAGTGRWPVLLGLANRAAVKATAWGMTATGSLRQIADRLAGEGPATFDPADPQQRSRAVGATVRAGLHLLPPATGQRFAELAIFAEDAPISVVTLELLWGATGGLSPNDVHRSCQALAELSLVLEYRLEAGTIRLHDVIRAYLVHLQSPGQLAALHSQLLDAAAALVPADPATGLPQWWQLADRLGDLDGHLVEHLVAAGRDDETVALVTDLRWLESRLRRDGPAAAEADLLLAPGADALAAMVRQEAHLLGPIEPDSALGCVLMHRVLQRPLLLPIAARHFPHLGRPRLMSRWPLDDSAQPALRRTLAGHTDDVVALAAPRDGAWLATGDGEGAVRVWDPVTGRTRHAWNAHTDGVSALAAAPGGEWLATGSYDGTARIWELRTGSCRHTLDDHTDKVTTVAVAPDGTWLATGSDDHTVRLWDTATGVCRHVLTGHTKTVYDVAVAPAGTWLATCGADETVRIWDTATGACRHVLGGHSGPVACLAIAPDGRWLASASWDNTARVWDADSGACQHTLTGHTLSLYALTIAPDGSWLATGGRDRVAVVWDAATGTPRHLLTGHTSSIFAFVVEPAGNWLATGSHDGTVRIWNARNGTCRQVLIGHTDSVTALASAPDQSWFATSSADHTTRIWDVTAEVFRPPATGLSGRVHALAVAPDGTWLATGNADGTVHIRDAATGASRHVAAQHTDWVRAVAIAPDGTWLATGSQDGTVRLWDPRTGACRHTLTDHAGEVSTVVIAPDGTWLASAGTDQTLRIWDPHTGTCRAVLDGHSMRIDSVVVSPDGRWIASTSWDAVRVWDPTGARRHVLADDRDWMVALAAAPDGTWLAAGTVAGNLRIWDLATGACRQTFAGHTGEVNTVAAAPDGSWLASGGDDGTVRIWELATGACRHVLSGHTDAVNAVAVSRDGTWLASGGDDGTIRIWDPRRGTALAAMRVNSQLAHLAVVADQDAVCAAGIGLYLFDVER